MKRTVRQRCGFGCVLCGAPIVEYHHMTPWSEVRVHEVENLTLLCDRHHKEATGARPLLPDSHVRRANADPFNRRTGASALHTLHFEGPECVIHLGGGNKIIGPPGWDVAVVAIDGHPLLGFRFEDDTYLIQFKYYDVDNSLLIEIVDNELTFSTSLWDVDWTANRIVVRAALREVILDMEFCPPNEVIVHRGQLHLNGVTVDIGSTWTTVGEVRMRDVTWGGSLGINAGHDQTHTFSGGIGIGTPKRLPGFEYAEPSACPKCLSVAESDVALPPN